MAALIELKHISKHYYLGETLVRALDDVSLLIKKGELLAITGASGSGKSTLMHILGCLDVPTSGSYFLDGKNVAQFTPVELAHIRNKLIGFVFQQFHLLPDLSAVDNVALPYLYAGCSESEARKEAHKLLDLVSLHDRHNHYPYQLSGGQQQRVAIARAFANNPEIVFADEPTGNLDSKTSNAIMALFLELNTKRNVTIILVTHEKFIAEQARRIITLGDGKIISDKGT